MLFIKIIFHSTHITLPSYVASHNKCFINIAEETFENKFFKETVVTTFAFNQSSSYITQNIIVQIHSNFCIAVFQAIYT